MKKTHRLVYVRNKAKVGICEKLSTEKHMLVYVRN